MIKIERGFDPRNQVKLRKDLTDTLCRIKKLLLDFKKINEPDAIKTRARLVVRINGQFNTLNKRLSEINKWGIGIDTDDVETESIQLKQQFSKIRGPQPRQRHASPIKVGKCE